MEVTGILDWPARSDGRVRQLNGAALVKRDDDPLVPQALGERFRLRSGMEVTVRVGSGAGSSGAAGGGGPPRGGGPRGFGHRARQNGPGAGGGPGGGSGYGPGGGPRGGGRAVVDAIVAIEGLDPAAYAQRKPFEELTSIDPQPRLTLEYPGCPASCRLIDLFCPIGRGQRGLIVSPPKAGKTTLLKDIATAVLHNHPDVEVWVVLIDERPEEVTDFRRTFAAYSGQGAGAAGAPGGVVSGVGAGSGGGGGRARCRVIGSSNDSEPDLHIQVALLAMDRCKRMVEAGKHVVVVMDSLTRLGRAFNNSRKYASGGRTMTGGIDSKALEVPKQIFGAARNTEEAGSLTIIASCLVDTGSAGDQVIFEEFKGTGNMELILDRKISERRLYPAINLAQSGTRKEHLLQPENEHKTIAALRRRLMAMPPPVQVEQLLAALQRFPSNGGLVGSAG